MKQLSKGIPKVLGVTKRYGDICKHDILSDKDQCVICLETYTEDQRVIVLDKCKHMFHKKCFKKWYSLKKTCPLDGRKLS